MNRAVVLALFPALFFSISLVEAGNRKHGKRPHPHEQNLETREPEPERLDAMVRDYVEAVDADLKRIARTIVLRMQHEYRQHQQHGTPYVRDLLLISGGGPKGAFGAGFLKGWGGVTDGPTARPEFDVVTGVSTGALLAPYAFVGTDESYAEVTAFYANPQDNWVRKRGKLAILPHHVSLFDDRGLQDYVHDHVDASLVEGIAAGAAEHRLLLVGTTNLDLGVGRVFDVGAEATRATEDAIERIHTILLASSAIPGIFPPVEIDGFYYVDGGATAQVFALTAFDQVHGLIERWRLEHADIPLPRYRIWIIVNEPLHVEPTLVRPRWAAVATHSLQTLMRASMLSSLRLIQDIATEARDQFGVDVEFRYVAIPTDAPQKPHGTMFEKNYMQLLEALGQKLGADPSSWRTVVPDMQWLRESG